MVSTLQIGKDFVLEVPGDVPVEHVAALTREMAPSSRVNDCRCWSRHGLWTVVTGIGRWLWWCRLSWSLIHIPAASWSFAQNAGCQRRSEALPRLGLLCQPLRYSYARPISSWIAVACFLTSPFPRRMR